MANVRSIRAVAMDYLAVREQSQYELAQKLERKGFLDEEINALLVTLQSQNLLSDQRFSESYVRYRAGKGYGPLRIQQELAQRGVNKELISQSLQQFSKEEWREMATRVYQKKHTNTSNNDYKQQAAYLRFLLYRGFSMQIAREVVGAQEYNLEN